jgi:hypothetical protein
LKPVLKNANHIDVKTVEGTITLREFVASMFNYQPGWVTFLYGVRAVFVAFLGMHQEGIPRRLNLNANDLRLLPGAVLGFFTIRLAKENEYIVAEIKDKHLDALLGVAVEPLQNEVKRFHVFTIVHYNNWAGPVYFNMIRPFHHLVVGAMVKAGAKANQGR